MHEPQVRKRASQRKPRAGSPGRVPLAERAQGMLAGVVLGDALGMPAEFLTPEQITECYGRIEGLVAPHPKHVHHRLPAGSVTDDTDQTLIIAELLLGHGEIKPTDLLEQLKAWSETDRVRESRFVGPSTLQVLSAFNTGVRLEDLPRGGTTVGAAMRLAPLAIAFSDREHLTQQVVACCAATHFTHNAISGAMAMAYALSEALSPSGNALSVARAAQEGAVVGRGYGNWSWASPIEKRIDHVLAWARKHHLSESSDFLYTLIGVDLYPQQLVPCAIGLVVLAESDPMPAMLAAANLGGDTDTLASMTGSLCGALAGISAFDARVVDQVERVNNLDLRSVAGKLLALRA